MTWWVGHDQRDLAAGRPSRRPRPRPQVGDDSSRNLRRRRRHRGRNFPHCPRLPVDGKLDQLRLLLQVVDLRDGAGVALDVEAEWALVVVVVEGPGLPGRLQVLDQVLQVLHVLTEQPSTSYATAAA